MRKLFMSIMFVCLMGMSFSFGHLWCEKHCGSCPPTPDKCLVKTCDCGCCKCCKDKKIEKKCDCSQDCTCGCVTGKPCDCTDPYCACCTPGSNEECQCKNCQCEKAKAKKK